MLLSKASGREDELFQTKLTRTFSRTILDLTSALPRFDFIVVAPAKGPAFTGSFAVPLPPNFAV